MKDSTTDRAHELWSAAQLAPGEGIEDGVARIEALLALPAPAGEPEMPEPVAYWWSPKDASPTTGTWSSNTGPHPDWDITRYFIANQLSAYGDARAEHARRVAMEEAADACIRIATACLGDGTGRADGADACKHAIRAAVPPQGEPQATQFDPAVPKNSQLRDIAKQARNRNSLSDTTSPEQYVLEGWREAEKHHGIHPWKRSQPQGEQTWEAHPMADHNRGSK